MARAGAAAAVLAFAVCCLLVSPAPARLTVDLPQQLPDAVDDHEAAAEKLLPKPLEAADQTTAIAVPESEDEGTAISVVVQEEEGPVPKEIRPHQKRSSLLCLVFRCGGGSTHERQALDGWAQPAVEGTAEEEVHDGEEHESDSDWDSDCDSDSDDEDEGSIMGWFWRLADAF